MFEADPQYPVFGLYFRRYVPFARFGRANPYSLGFGTFEGDDRGVSTSLKVTSRTYAFVMFNRFGVVHSFAGSSGTHFHPTLLGVKTGMSTVHHKVVRNNWVGPDLFGFRANTAGNNPLVKPSPDINSFVDIRVDFGEPSKLKINGEAFGDNFPNFEVFLLCYRSSRTALLLDGQTTGTPSLGPGTRLFGAKESHSLAKFSLVAALDEKGELASNSTVGPTKLP